MGRLNKTTEGVFVNIVGTSKERSTYDQFITRSNGSDQPGGYCLADFVTEYSNKVSKHKVDIQQLADLEVIIMQVKAFGNMNDNIKLYTSKDKYIYARTKFYRIDNNINEVRVLIDPIDLYFPDGTADFAILSGNEFFMDRVYDKLSTVMSQEIQENVDNYNKIYSKNICDIPNLK
jgi:hypothetical protein